MDGHPHRITTAPDSATDLERRLRRLRITVWTRLVNRAEARVDDRRREREHADEALAAAEAERDRLAAAIAEAAR